MTNPDKSESEQVELEVPHHSVIDAMALDAAGDHYQYWVERLTSDSLHRKSDIARVLAWYRRHIATLHDELAEAKKQNPDLPDFLRRKMEGCKSHRVTMCAFCDYLAQGNTIAQQANDITRHVLECKNHPLLIRAEIAKAALAKAPHAEDCASRRCRHCDKPAYDICHERYLNGVCGVMHDHDFEEGDCTPNCYKHPDYEGVAG